MDAVKDFEDIIELLEDKKAKAWVNCPRRTYPFYHEMQECFNPGEQIFFNLFGGGWGLACNSIHVLDLFSYLTGENNIRLNVSGLDRTIQKSKKNGFNGRKI